MGCSFEIQKLQSTRTSEREAGCTGLQLLSDSAGKERQVSFLGDRGSHGGTYGPACCGCQLLDFCVQFPDYPLHGFTALIKNKQSIRWEYKENYIMLNRKGHNPFLLPLKKNEQ